MAYRVFDFELDGLCALHTTAVSMIDRSLHHVVVVVTKGESFRMKEAKTSGGELAKEKA